MPPLFNIIFTSRQESFLRLLNIQAKLAEGEEPMDQITLNFFWLMLLATVVAMLGRFIRIPYTIALVFCGLGVGFLGLLPGVHLNPQLLFALFLPLSSSMPASISTWCC